MKRKPLLTIMIFLAICGNVWAQRQIAGRVTDETNEALVGVAVSVRGTAAGTTTDENGVFQLTVPEDATTLTFQSIGYTTRMMSITATGDSINVQMALSAQQLQGTVANRPGHSPRKTRNWLCSHYTE